jgi:hypothetical protein
MGKIDAVRRSTIKESSFKPQYCRSSLDMRIPDSLINDKLASESVRIVQ